jgi:hypothetical protein
MNKLETIREALDRAIKAIQKMDSVDPMALLEMGYGYSVEVQPIIDAICRALAALDTLEQKPSEDARRIVSAIRNADTKWLDFDLADNEAATLITTDRAITEKRVREETIAEAVRLIRCKVEGGPKCPESGEAFYTYMNGVGDAVEAACAVILGHE